MDQTRALVTMDCITTARAENSHYFAGHKSQRIAHFMVTPSYTAAELIARARSGKAGRDAVLTTLYQDQKLRDAIFATVYKFGGKKEDAETVLVNTLMQFVKTIIKRSDFEMTSSLQAYLCGIAKFTWFKESKAQQKAQTETLDRTVEFAHTETPEKLILNQSRANVLHALLKHLGANCKEVLMHWANGYSMKEIATMMDYKSDMMARKKKYKCFKELMIYLQQHPQIKEALE